MKARKLLATLLALAMTLSMLSVGALAAETEDEKNGVMPISETEQTAPVSNLPADAAASWASGSIERWTATGVVKGDGNGNFNPDASLSRAELAQIFVNMFGLTVKAENTFGDLKGDEWYADAILKCVAAGIMKGDGVNANAEAKITRAETIVMFGRAVGVTPDAKPDLSKFTDADSVADWAAGYMAPLTKMGILSGSGDGTINAAGQIDRASTMALMDKAVAEYVNAPGEYKVDNANGFVVVNVAAKEGEVVISGTAAGVAVSAGTAEGKVVAKDLKADTIKVDGTAALSVEGKSSVGEVVANNTGAITVAKGVTVDTVTANAAGTITNNGTIKELTANAPAKVDNQGTITKAEIKADGVILDGKKPTEVKVEEGTKNPTDSKGNEIKPVTPPTGGGGGGSYTPPAIDNVKTVWIANGEDYTAKLPASYVKQYPWSEYQESAEPTLPWLVVTYARNITAENIKITVTKDGAKVHEETLVKEGGYATNSDAYAMMRVREFNVTPITAENEQGTYVTTIKIGDNTASVTYNKGTTVKNEAELKAALEAEAVKAIFIDGTIGNSSEYVEYTVNRPVAIKGGTVYGNFVVKAEGVTFDGVTIRNKGDMAGANTLARAAIYAACDKITITGCTFDMNSGATGITNGVVVYPITADVEYTISGNTFKGFKNSDTGWTSTALSLVGGSQKLGQTNPSVLADLSDDEDLAIIEGNTFEECKVDYSRYLIDGTNKISCTSISNGGNTRFASAADAGAKYYITGNVTRDFKDDQHGGNDVDADLVIKANTEVIITEGAKLTIADGVTLDVNGTLNVMTNGAIAGTVQVEAGGTMCLNSEADGITNTKGNIVGADSLDVTTGHVTVEIGNNGMVLTIPAESVAETKGGCWVNEAKDNTEYRVARNDELVVEGTLTVSYDVKITGKLTIGTAGTFTVGSGKELKIAHTATVVVVDEDQGAQTLVGADTLDITEGYATLTADTLTLTDGTTAEIKGAYMDHLTNDVNTVADNDYRVTRNDKLVVAEGATLNVGYSTKVTGELTVDGIMNVPAGQSLEVVCTVSNHKGVLIVNGALNMDGTLTNNGTLTVDGNLTNNGTIDGAGVIDGEGDIWNNYGSSALINEVQVVGGDDAIFELVDGTTLHVILGRAGKGYDVRQTDAEESDDTLSETEAVVLKNDLTLKSGEQLYVKNGMELKLGEGKKVVFAATVNGLQIKENAKISNVAGEDGAVTGLEGATISSNVIGSYVEADASAEVTLTGKVAE